MMSSVQSGCALWVLRELRAGGRGSAHELRLASLKTERPYSESAIRSALGRLMLDGLVEISEGYRPGRDGFAAEYSAVGWVDGQFVEGYDEWLREVV